MHLGRRRAFVFAGCLMSVPLIAWPQVVSPAAGAMPVAAGVMITEPVDESQRVVLKGQTHRALRDSQDLGEADPRQPAQRVIMVLRGSAEQDADLSRYLKNAQSRGSRDYHRWMTPQTFGRRFGAAAADRAIVRTWLVSKGFVMEDEPAGGRSLVFSGTLGRVNEAFGTHIHRYRWHGEEHLANATNPSIPMALARVVAGFASLNDFRSHAQWVRAQRVQPQYTTGSAHYLAPGDFATIYDLNSSYAGGVTGAGRSIAVIGRSNVATADLSDFRADFGLSATLPTFIYANSAAAPPPLVSGDELESDLDLEWSGAVAPSATIKFVTTASTALTDGVDLASQWAVSNNLADVITVSYGGCENAGDVSGGTTFYQQLWQQAAAQGTSVFVSAGDSGAAGCDVDSASTATHGLAVNALCSSPDSTCVGGTEFSADVANPGTYWSSSNASGSQASALGYIGEAVWNQSGSVSGGSELYASGGGASIYFAKPAWQLAAGVPSDGRRDVPDLALSASFAHDAYLVVSSDGYPTGTLLGVGGTSACAPSMAGIAALVAQGEGGRVGNFNPVLYGLSGQQLAGGGAVFHRITAGNNSVPGQTGFSASTGDSTYNQATGLGSIDGAQLIAHWNDYAASPAGLAPTTAVLPASAVVGSATLTLPASTSWSAAVGGGGASWLSVTPASGTGSAPLTYAASANSASSARSGTITVDGQVLTVTQTAGSGSTAQASLSSSTLGFGADVINQPSPSQLILISDTGNASLTLSAISVSGADTNDFSYSGSCEAGLVLSPGASCYLNVTFDPTALGSRTASLQIAFAGGGSTSVNLSGTGAADAPLPLWAYGLLAMGLCAIAARQQRSAAAVEPRRRSER